MELKQLRLEMVLSPEAEKLYKDFVVNLEIEMGNLNDERGEVGFLGRLAIYTLKLSMLYQISENPQETIFENAMYRAIRLVNRAKRDILELLENQLGNTEFENCKQRVLSLIRKNRIIERTKLMQNLRDTSKDYLDKILETLIEAELIKEDKNEIAGQKPRRYYRILQQ